MNHYFPVKNEIRFGVHFNQEDIDADDPLDVSIVSAVATPLYVYVTHEIVHHWIVSHSDNEENLMNDEPETKLTKHDWDMINHE